MKFKFFILFTLILPLQAITLKNEIINSKPWGYYNHDGIVQGLLAEYINELGKTGNFDVVNVISPYARVWRNLDNGSSDISVLIRSRERKNNVEYIGHIIDFKTVIIPRKNISIKKYDDLKNLRIGVLIGSKMNKKFDEDKSIKKRYFRSYEIMLNLLKENRIDAFLGLNMSIFYLAKEKDLLPLLGEAFELEHKEIWLHLSKKSQYLQYSQMLKNSIEKLKKKNFMEQLLEKYMGKNWKEIN